MLCTKCGYQWSPRPRNWTQLPVDGEKLIKCPSCQHWNTMILDNEPEIAVILANPVKPVEEPAEVPPQEEAFSTPPTQAGPADLKPNTDDGKTASGAQETSASPTTSESGEEPITPTPWMTYLHSAASQPAT